MAAGLQSQPWGGRGRRLVQNLAYVVLQSVALVYLNFNIQYNDSGPSEAPLETDHNLQTEATRKNMKETFHLVGRFGLLL